jgi:hypothetical protein
VLAACAFGVFVFVPSIKPAPAATTNVSVQAPDVVAFPFLVAGQRTATQTAVVRFKLPFPAQVLGVSATARVSGGTTPTLTIDVMDDGVSVLTTPVTVTGGAVAEASLDSTKITIGDESVITINTAIGGTSPTWDDICVLITLVRT